ncbi:MAG: hypothetical protein ACP5Q1_08945, partial [Anaerolineae bacterium]
LISAMRGYSRFPFQAFSAEAKRRTLTLPEFSVLVPMQPPTLDKEQQALLREVFCGKDELRPGVVERFRAAGQSIVPHLLDILDDPDLIKLNAPGRGWAPGHAAFLLGELGASETVEHLITAVVRTPPDSHLAEEAAAALIKLGSASLPAIEEFVRWSENQEAKNRLDHIAKEIRHRKKGMTT